ncbi:MAG: 30S ribosome-binding factor RbfA [Candidatus Zixiibacteriota bacterium]
MKQYKRSVRIGEQIHRELASALGERLEERFTGLVTFTRVRVSDDLRYATVYYSYLGSESNRQSVDSYFRQEAGRIRKLVGGPLRIRHIPEFRFEFDPSIEEGIRIEQLLNEIKDDLQRK